MYAFVFLIYNGIVHEYKPDLFGTVLCGSLRLLPKMRKSVQTRISPSFVTYTISFWIKHGTQCHWSSAEDSMFSQCNTVVTKKRQSSPSKSTVHKSAHGTHECGD